MPYILTIVFTLLSAYYDAEELKAGRYFKDHTPRALFRVLVLFIISVLFNTHVLILISVFYLIFDISLNLMRELPWNYVGTVSVTDSTWQKIGGWIPQYIFKILFTIITIKYL